MKTWNIGSNKLYDKGIVYVSDQPWWLICVGWFIDVVLSRGYSFFQWIPLPDWFPKHRDGADGIYTLKEWYGTFGDLWFCFVYTPALHWHAAKEEKYLIRFEIRYDELDKAFRKIYPDFFEIDDEIEKSN